MFLKTLRSWAELLLIVVTAAMLVPVIFLSMLMTDSDL